MGELTLYQERDLPCLCQSLQLSCVHGREGGGDRERTDKFAITWWNRKCDSSNYHNNVGGCFLFTC